MNRSDFLKTVTTAGLGLGFSRSPLYSHLLKSDPDRDPGNHSFNIRGFHLDMRVEVMTIQAIKDFAKYLSRLGINALMIEYEASFPYQKQATITGGNSYKREELEDLVAYCNGLGIQVIPLLENLGHVQYILRHERYAGLRIAHDILSQVDPLNKETIPLFNDLIEDLIDVHPSKYIHLGGDEARHLDDKKFEDYVQKNGLSKLYTQYMKQICDIAVKRGKTPLLWADMILKHPEAVEDLPIDKIIFINWIYSGADADRFGNVKALQDKGCTFWGAPALRCGPDNYFLTRWEHHFNNIKEFIPYSRRAGYEGMIMTSWSTSGAYDYHWEGTSDALMEMFPKRNVYPLSGFNILVEAYAKALSSKGPIDPRQFTIHYSGEKFGLAQEEGVALWNYLAHTQVIIKSGKSFEKQDVSGIRRAFHEVSLPVKRIKPKRNQQEFDQFKLMADIRLFYLSVREVELITESSDFDHSRINQVRELLKPLSGTAVELNHRFIALNKGYLFDSELDRLNNLRNHRLNRLRDIYGA